MAATLTAGSAPTWRFGIAGPTQDFACAILRLARNWLIGSKGDIKGSLARLLDGRFPRGTAVAGQSAEIPKATYDQSGENARHVQPRSLYYAQLQQKLKWPGSQFREYRLGDIDQLVWNPEVDSTSDSTRIGKRRCGVSVQARIVSSAFDAPATNRWPAFTFQSVSHQMNVSWPLQLRWACISRKT